MLRGAESIRGRRLLSLVLKTAWVRMAVVGNVVVEDDKTEDSASA